MYYFDENARKMKFIKDWLQKRTDLIYNKQDPYQFWYDGSHSKYYQNEIVCQEPFSYRISVYVTDEYIEVQACLYSITVKNNIKELKCEVDRFDFEFVQEENLVPIISYVQELDIKFEKYVKDYIIKYKLKDLENDFKK